MTDSSSMMHTPATDSESPKRKSRIIAAASAVGGMIIGSIVGIAVQVGVESTGILGPGVDSLLAEQEANFAGINERLDALQNATTSPELSVHVTELRSLLERQRDISNQAGTELRLLSEQLSQLRNEQLEQSGFASGADFWLKNGESVNVGDESQVFGLIRFWGSNRRADINLSGERQRMTVGDALAVPGDDCTIFYKQATPRADGRIGFDISCG